MDFWEGRMRRVCVCIQWGEGASEFSSGTPHSGDCSPRPLQLVLSLGFKDTKRAR